MQEDKIKQSTGMIDETKTGDQNVEIVKVNDSKNGIVNNAKNSVKKKKKKNSFVLYRVLKTVLRPLSLLLWPTKIINKENVFKIEGGLVICNHYSGFDAVIPLIRIFKKEAHTLAKYELFEKPFVGWLFRKMGAIPVHRGEADIDAVKEVLTVLRSDKKLLIFPEGTRNKAGTKEMAEFKDGTSRFAIKTNSPIVPMIYYRTPEICKKNWLYIGEPFTLEQFKGARTQEEYKLATDFIYEKMLQTRALCDEYVENKRHGKKN